MKKITRTLFVLILIVSLLSALCVGAFAEDASGVTGENTAEEFTNAPDNSSSSEPDSVEETVQGTAAYGDTASTPSNISLTAPNETLKVGEAFGTTYSYTTGNLVVAYDYVLLDKNGNVTEGKDAGTYTITFQNIRVYDISTDPNMTKDISSQFHITTTNGTLTRTGSSSSSSSGTASGTSNSGTTSSTTSVKTGDENDIGMWVIIGVIAFAGVSAVSAVLLRRKVSK